MDLINYAGNVRNCMVTIQYSQPGILGRTRSLRRISTQIHHVNLGNLYRSSLVPPGTLHNKPPRMGGTTFFLFIFISTTIKRIHNCTMMPF